MRLFLGIDDTDVLGHRPGTGRLARELGTHLQERALTRLQGVVRHQLLVDPRIPYTSHNSPACLILQAEHEGSVTDIFEEVADYVGARAANGSDPGICLVPAEEVPAEAVAFGLRAASEVLTKAEATALAKRACVLLRELGGTGDGVIGALAAVGLTSHGNAGRFLELGGDLRDLPETVKAATLAERGVALVSAGRNGDPVPPDAEIFTAGWCRPRLIAGGPVLLVEREGSRWRCVDRKKDGRDRTEGEE